MDGVSRPDRDDHRDGGRDGDGDVAGGAASATGVQRVGFVILRKLLVKLTRGVRSVMVDRPEARIAFARPRSLMTNVTSGRRPFTLIACAIQVSTP